MLSHRAPLLLTLALGFAAASVPASADAPGIKDVLRFRPTQTDVEIDTPDPADYDKCKVTTDAKGTSWIVLGPTGQTLRRFVDTNGDNVVDHWRYFHRGLEVYRDIDSDFNKKPDQHRWLNAAGSRWAVDKNEDGKIDSWKFLSAEEASREAVRALAKGDAALLQTVLVTDDDLQTLGIAGELAKRIKESTADPAGKLRKVLTGAKSISAKTNWLRFDSAHPSAIPADHLGTKTDLVIYENGMAIVETGSTHGVIQLGELLKVGDVWKLTRIPQPFEANQQLADAAPLFVPELPAGATAPAAATAAAGDGELNPEVEKLLKELMELDQKIPAPTAARREIERYHVARAAIMERLVAAVATDEEREQWTRQLVDGITAAIQVGAYPAGLKKLESLQKELERKKASRGLLAYVAYRQLAAGYSLALQDGDAEKRNELQEQWVKDLTAFAAKYPDAEDAPEALWQLAMTEEFSGKFKEARALYERLATGYANTAAGRRGRGALKRLDLKGRTLVLKGQSTDGSEIDVARLSGKVVLVLYWATWCKPCTEDLPQIRALYEQYHDRGFEIVGVNLDSQPELIAPYLKEHRIRWPHIHEPGGLDSPAAEEFGIVSLPTMFVVDAQGKVVSRGATVSELKTLVPELLKAE
jgi:thiol-disulfide isomerase/thioredoxin